MILVQFMYILLRSSMGLSKIRKLSLWGVGLKLHVYMSMCGPQIVTQCQEEKQCNYWPLGVFSL